MPKIIKKYFFQLPEFWYGFCIASVMFFGYYLFTQSMVSPSVNKIDSAVMTQFQNMQAAKNCVPRPACLDATPPCLPVEPAEGFCSTASPVGQPSVRPNPKGSSGPIVSGGKACVLKCMLSGGGTGYKKCQSKCSTTPPTPTP